jgi:hypothetical protein
VRFLPEISEPERRTIGGWRGNCGSLRDKASWVEPQIGPNDDCFDGYPELSIEDWHKKHGLWIE